LMYLKQKRCGRIKARGCADGRKQCDYKTKKETSSPTVSTEAVFLTTVINAQEWRQVMMIDIPGVFMHVDIDELIHVRLEGPMAELLTRVDPDKYRTYLSKEYGKDVLYVKLQKALYCMLQASLLFWENLTEFLTQELGFEVNPYDSCVVNKTIDGKQCTILWHVNDLKLSHVKQEVLEDIVKKINAKYGQQTPIVIHRGKIHDYMGMTIDYSEEGKVKFMMFDCVESILEEALADMDGVTVTSATLELFTVNEDAEPLDDHHAETYHRLTAKQLYLCKRARPDLQPTVAFLTTRVVHPTINDWRKLSRSIWYLRGSKELVLTLEADEGINVKWWIDASFAVHPDMRTSHTGNTMSLRRGSVYSTSRKQQINTKSSTEAELVGVDDSMPLVVWTRNFWWHRVSRSMTMLFFRITKVQCCSRRMAGLPVDGKPGTLTSVIFL
jgi:Reverse transcriptase (RNA-dependent DNA polymerase)